MRIDTVKLKKLLLKALPYLLFGLFCTHFGQAWRMAEGTNASEQLLSFFQTAGAAFRNPLPSLHPVDLLTGLLCGAGLWAAVYVRGKNAKHFGTTSNMALPAGAMQRISNPSSTLFLRTM